MGRAIFKAAPDQDLYLEWSSSVEAPVFFGTRAQTEDHLSTPDYGTALRSPALVEEMLQRADDTGTSDRGGRGAWDDTVGMIYQQQGWLRRDKIPELANRIAASPRSFEYADLLEPFEDDE